MSRILKPLIYSLIGGIGGITAILIIFIGTSIFQAKYYLETFLEEAPQEDIPLVYDKVVIHKVFPAMTLKIKKLGLDGWHGVEGEVSESFIKYSLFHPHIFSIKMPIVELKYLGQDIVISDLEIILDPFFSDREKIHLTFQSISFVQEETPKKILEKGRLTIRSEVVEAHNDQGLYKIPSLHIEGEAKEIHLNESVGELGPDIKDISIKATIQEDDALFPKKNLSFQESLKQWREKGGVIDIEKISFTWGAVWGNAEGTLALDADLFPEGAFTVHLKGISAFLRSFVKNKKMPSDQKVIVQVALGLLEANVHNDFVLPITLQNKKIQIGDFLKIPLK